MLKTLRIETHTAVSVRRDIVERLHEMSARMRQTRRKLVPLSDVIEELIRIHDNKQAEEGTK